MGTLMVEIIDWLIKMEKLAGDFYADAAEHFKENLKINRYLHGAAEDEAMHFHVMGSAKTQLEHLTLSQPLITLSDEVKQKLETPFTKANASLYNGTLAIEGLIDCIIETEFSEWNKIFLYVVNSLKAQIRQFYYSAAKIQNHMGRTLHFLESIPYGARKVGELQLLERVFEENILVVDDDNIIAEFMESLLEEEGNVDVAHNGEEALEKMEEKYYKLVVTDINMPVMNGIDFFKKARERYPTMSKRFMIVTGHAPRDVVAFAEEHQIVLLPKPSPLDDILKNAQRILHEIDDETL